MSDTAAPTATPTTPAAAPASNDTSGGGNEPKATIRHTPVSASASASKVNQQAVAAGENVNRTQTTADPEPAVPDPKVPATDPLATAEPGPATLETPPPGFLHIESGNKVVDQVSQLLANQNFEGAQEIIAEIIDTQELTLTSKAALVAGLGADVANLVINQLETSVAAVKEAGTREGQRLKQVAMERFGGTDPEAVWEGIQEFARSSDAGLSQGERNTMNELLAAGGTKAELVINHLADKYEKSSKYTSVPYLMEGSAAGTVGFQPLSKAEYQQLIGPAIRENGEASTEVQALRNRRSISISRGY